jgi:hypothetical protein
MKKYVRTSVTGLLFYLLIGFPQIIFAQNSKAFVKEYLNKITVKSIDQGIQKYRMTAIYTNRDIFG